MKSRDEWLHRMLDGVEDPDSEVAGAPEELARLALYRETLLRLEDGREGAPEGFVERVMAAVPDQPDGRWYWRVRGLWPAHGRWALPAAVGALAALVLWVGLSSWQIRSARDRVAVRFELHAPAAQRVEVVGSFNAWKPGEIVLEGPDPTGHWEATVRLPEGRYEYMFLVDGREVPDPRADAYRPDGFGGNNALLEI